MNRERLEKYRKRLMEAYCDPNVKGTPAPAASFLAGVIEAILEDDPAEKEGGDSEAVEEMDAS